MSLKDFEIVPFQKEGSDLWYGRLSQNKPTPSGCDRLIPLFSTNQGRDTAEKAVLEIVHLVMVKPKHEPLTLQNTAVHSRFVESIKGYLENPNPEVFE